MRHYVGREPRNKASTVHAVRIAEEFADPIIRWNSKRIGRPFAGRGWFNAWRVRAAIEEVTQ